jgi:hypothetical protein
VPWHGQERGGVRLSRAHVLWLPASQKSDKSCLLLSSAKLLGRKQIWLTGCGFLPALALQLIAARLRPENLPAYEVLYKTAGEVEHKREERKKLQEMAQMEVGRLDWAAQQHGLRLGFLSRSQ